MRAANVDETNQRSSKPFIATLDLREAEADGSTRKSFQRRLRESVHGIGAFYLTGHGIDEDLCDALLRHGRRLFELPSAALATIDMIHSPHFRGYTPPGNERTAGRADRREQLDVAFEAKTRERSPDHARYWLLQGPNQWPAALPALRIAVLDYMERLQAVAARLLAALLEALGLRRDYFTDAFSPDPHVHLKIVRYPGSDDGATDQGVGAHKDYGFLTLLLQDTASGLQVSDGVGGYIDVPPVPGTFVINLGEMLEVASGGYVTATTHRVVSPPPGTDRLSIPFFFNPRLDYITTPLAIASSLAAPSTRRVEDTRDVLFTEYGRNALRGWFRSHPRVAERYYSELLTVTDSH